MSYHISSTFSIKEVFCGETAAALLAGVFLTWTNRLMKGNDSLSHSAELTLIITQSHTGSMVSGRRGGEVRVHF